MQALQAIEAVTRVERNGVLAAVREAIQKLGGFITDHQLFGNIAANIVFELPAARLSELSAK